MKKINKNINIALIFMLIGVFLCQGITFAKDCSLRPALQTANPGFIGQMTHLQIRQRYEELRKRFGSKAAWLIILKELGLPERLGFRIPDFVCFEYEEARAIYDKYKSEGINGLFDDINKEIGDIPGYGFNYPFGDFKIEIYLRGLYGLDMSDEEFGKQIDLLLNKEFKPLLKYASREEWVNFFTGLRQAPHIKRLINNKKERYAYPEATVKEEAQDYLRQAIKSFLFFNTFRPQERKELLEKIESLPLRMIVRSSGFKEDSFEASLAGRYVSLIVDRFNWLWAAANIMNPKEYQDTVTGKLIDTNRTIFIQEYVPAEKAGIVFSNLSGYATIECVVGDGSTATSGVNNTIIDLTQDGKIEEINYGTYKGAIRMICWDGFRLDLKGNNRECEQALETMQKRWHDNVALIKDMNGVSKESPFSEKEIQFVRKIALEIEKAVGFPVDLELNFKDKTLNMIQMRPITGENSPIPKKLPEFKKEDIIARVPISIGTTSEQGFSGYLLSFMSQEDEYLFWESKGKVIFRKPGSMPDEVIIVSNEPLPYSWLGYKTIIDGNKSSRIYHNGIILRERGTVIGGIPGIKYGAIPALKWKKVQVNNIDDKPITLLVSTIMVKYFSNNFRGILVKAGALPILQKTPVTSNLKGTIKIRGDL